MDTVTLIVFHILIGVIIVLICVLCRLKSVMDNYQAFYINSQADQNVNHYRLAERVLSLEKRLDRLEWKGEKDGPV